MFHHIIALVVVVLSGAGGSTVLLSTDSSPSLADPVLRLRVSVAQCRALCPLHQPARLRQSSSEQLVEVDECWSACGSLAEAVNIELLCREDITDQRTTAVTCGAGCRRACRYYLNQNDVPSARSGRLRSASSAPLEFSPLPSLQGCRLSWGRPLLSANSLRTVSSRQLTASRPVYLLLGLDGAGQWYEVNQTEETQTTIAFQTLAKLHELLLVAVGRHGALTSSQVSVSEAAILACRPPSPEQLPQQQQPSRLTLQGLESDDGVLYRAVVSWTAPIVKPSSFHHLSSTAQYLVRWRTVPEGFVAGSLLTNATTATLALLPDSHVLVEVSPLLLSGSGVDHRQLVTSTPLIISTFRQTTTVGLSNAAKTAAALAVALFSLALSLVAFLAMIIKLYQNRGQKASNMSATLSRSSNNNSNITSISNNFDSKLINEDAGAPSRPLSPCFIQARNMNSFKFPVNQRNLNEKLISQSMEQEKSSYTKLTV